MLDWLVPAVVYMVGVGTLGITTKLALRSIDWPALILWTALMYGIIAVVLLASGTRLSLRGGTGMAIASGVIASGGLILLFIALGRGAATQVVPVTAAAPVVTAVLAALWLSEPIGIRTILGTGLVVAGVVLVTTG